MTKRIVIPTILAATILVAGIFALMPVEKASTVHTTILASTGKQIAGTLTADPSATVAAATVTAFDAGAGKSAAVSFTITTTTAIVGGAITVTVLDEAGNTVTATAASATLNAVVVVEGDPGNKVTISEAVAVTAGAVSVQGVAVQGA